MLASIILDTFRERESQDIARALDEICCPSDTYAFSSAALYAFWSVPQQELLYIGLAKDVGQRFRQHTRLAQCDVNCCKQREIASYFKNNEWLGYSILVQSSLDQPMDAVDEAAIANAMSDDLFTGNTADVFHAESNIAIAEGMLLECTRDARGRLPTWNRIGGSVHGREQRSLYPYAVQTRMAVDLVNGQPTGAETSENTSPRKLLLNMTGSEQSELNSRSSLREIAADATICGHELLLHAARMLCVMDSLPFEQAFAVVREYNPSAEERFRRMKADGYLNKVVALMGIDGSPGKP